MSRVLPLPAGAESRTARAMGSDTHCRSVAVSVAISRSRPTHDVRFPRSVRGPSAMSRSP